MEKKTYFANWENEDFAKELISQSYPFPEEMPTDYEDFPNVCWVSVRAARCKCSKFIEIEERELEKNNNMTVYCRFCGTASWKDGVYECALIRNEDELNDFLKQGYSLSKYTREMIEKMGYEIMDEKLAKYAVSDYAYCGQDVVGYCNVCGKAFGPNAEPDCGHAD